MHFPSPQELLDLLNLTDESSPLEKVCREIPFLPTVRYYQERAEEGIIRAIGRGQKNALVTLATGTGKTFIAYQALGFRNPDDAMSFYGDLQHELYAA